MALALGALSAPDGLAAAPLATAPPASSAEPILFPEPRPALGTEPRPSYRTIPHCVHIGQLITISPYDGVPLSIQLRVVAQHSVRSVGTREYDALRDVLRAARESTGVSQEDLSRRLGRPITYVGKVELGSRRLDVVEFMEIADGLGVDAVALLAEVKSRLRS